MIVGMSFGMKLKSDQMWPQYIKFFQKLTPSIRHLELFSNFNVSDGNYPRKLSGEPLYSVSRLNQERRFKLLFLAYLTLRHQTLSRMILPADLVTVSNNGEIRHHLIAEKPSVDTPLDCSFIWKDISPSVGEDEILNATLVRRHKWSELCNTPDTDFIVDPLNGKTKNNIPSSEVYYNDQKYWQMVDVRPFQPDSMAKDHHWKSHSVDELIDSYKTFEWREKWAAAAVAAAHIAGSRRLRRKLGRASPRQRAKQAYRHHVAGYSN